MYNKILDAIKKYDRIIIHRHSNPDGDALGSQIGLKNILKENFPQKDIYTVGDASKRYGFM
jgi:phosphoesterase RecJ-like protein